MATLNELAAAVHPPGTLDASTSLFNGAMSAIVAGTATLREVLTGIAAGEWATEVAAVRTAITTGQKDRAEYLKKRLPAFTASGLLSTRSKACDERLITHTGWLQADFDAKENPGMVQGAARAALQSDPHVGAVFVGPSGAGIKALLRIDAARHAESALSAGAYFEETHGLKMDAACKDIERLCFISHDPEAWMRPDAATVLPVTVALPPASAPEQRQQSTGSTAPEPEELLAWRINDVREVLSFLKTRPDYPDWLNVVSGVSSVLPMAEAISVLKEWMPPEKPGEYEDKWHHRLSRITIRTVIHMAKAKGFDAAAASRRRRWMGRMTIGGKEFGPGQSHADLLTEDVDPDPDGKAGESWEALGDQQTGDARLFEAKCSREWKYDESIQRWRYYNKDRGVWQRDMVGKAMHAMQKAALESYKGLLTILTAQRDDRAKQGGKDKKADLELFDEELKQVRTRIINLNKADWCRGVMILAKGLTGFAAKAEEFDKKPHILVLGNGYIDFKNNSRGEFTPEHLVTAASPVNFIEGATCPLFDEFLLGRMGGNQETVDYIWRCIGYSLTGFTNHDAVFIHFGNGSNGKSTFFRVIRELLGRDLSMQADIGVLLDGAMSSGSADYHKAALAGKRLVCTSEMDEDKPLNEAMIKALLGGEEVKARQIYEAPTEFTPTHKIWVGTNHCPTIKGTDNGIWRRIHLIPWEHAFTESEARPRDEMVALYCTELPGILNRALEGYGDFLARGSKIDPPPAVQEATARYRQDQNVLGNFLEEHLIESPLSSIKVVTLLRKYREWCTDTKQPLTMTVSSQMVKKLKEAKKYTILNRGNGAVSHLMGYRLECDPEPKFSNQGEIPF